MVYIVLVAIALQLSYPALPCNALQEGRLP